MKRDTDPYALDLTVDKTKTHLARWISELFGTDPDDALDMNLPAGHGRINISPDGRTGPVIGCAGALSLVMPDGTVRTKPGHAPVPDDRFLSVARSVGYAYQRLRQITAGSVPLKTELSLLACGAAGGDYALRVLGQWPHKIDARKSGLGFMACAVADAFGLAGQAAVTAYLTDHAIALPGLTETGTPGRLSVEDACKAYEELYRNMPSGDWPAVPDITDPVSPVAVLRRRGFPDVFAREWPGDVMTALLAAATVAVCPPPFPFLKDPGRYIEYLEAAAGAAIPDLSGDPGYVRLRATTPERFAPGRKIVTGEDHLLPAFTKTFQENTFLTDT